MSQVTAPGDPSVVPRRGAGCSPRHRPMDIALDCYAPLGRVPPQEAGEVSSSVTAHAVPPSPKGKAFFLLTIISQILS